MKPLVIIINGKGGVGKDTVCKVINNHYVTYMCSSITPIKYFARMMGWEGEKTDKARKMLSDLKNICIEYNDLPFKYMKDRFDVAVLEDVEIAIFCIREPMEIAKFRNFIRNNGYTCVTLLIRSTRTQQSYGNHSDDDVEDYPYDMVYQNDGTLENLDKDFMKFWNKEMYGKTESTT